MSLDSILNIVTPATDRALLTIDDLREAADVSDKSQDSELRKLGLRVAARITRACRIRAGGATPPTLRQETVLETFRSRGGHLHFDTRGPHRLRLARRPIVSISTLAYDGVSQDITRLLVDQSAGFIEYSSGCGAFWGNEIAVQYVAGWQIVPDDLKLAAITLAQQYLAAAEQTPGLRSMTIPGVVERQWWIGHPGDPDVPQSIMDMLTAYRNED